MRKIFLKFLKANFDILFLFLFVCIFLGPTARADKKEVLGQVSKDLATSKLLLLGESTHQNSVTIDFLTEVLGANSKEIAFVAFETAARHQVDFDDYLSGRADRLDGSTDTSSGNPQAQAAVRRFFEKAKIIRDAQVAAGKHPIQIIALDSNRPSPEGDDAFRQWFANRDSEMANRVENLARQLPGKGIVFLGGAHLTRRPYALPEQLFEVGLADKKYASLFPIYHNIGSLLAEKKIPLIAYWIQPPLKEEEISHMVKDWLPLYQIMPALFPSAKDMLWIDSSDRRIVEKEEDFHLAKDAFSLVRGYDRLVWLP